MTLQTQLKVLDESQSIVIIKNDKYIYDGCVADYTKQSEYDLTQKVEKIIIDFDYELLIYIENE